MKDYLHTDGGLALPKPVKREKRRKRVRRVKRAGIGQPTLKRLDDLARSLCRSRGRCEAVGFKGTTCSGVLQWAHVVSRQYKRNGLRWRMDNCFCLCQGHHFRWTKKNEAEWHEFLYAKIGTEKVLKLEREALYGDKHDKVEVLRQLIDLHVRGLKWGYVVGWDAPVSVEVSP